MTITATNGPWPVQFVPAVCAELRRLAGGIASLDTRLSVLAGLIDDATASMRAGADQFVHPGNVNALAASLADAVTELRRIRKVS